MNENYEPIIDPTKSGATGEGITPIVFTYTDINAVLKEARKSGLIRESGYINPNANFTPGEELFNLIIDLKEEDGQPMFRTPQPFQPSSPNSD